MGYPLNNGTDDLHYYTYYQGVIAGQLISTLALYYLIQSIHYGIWGHEQEAWEFKKNQEGEAAVEPLPPSEWKWDQKSFNMYFPIIFGTHISAVFLPLMYLPNIYTCAVSYIHLICFCGMLINTICIDEDEPGKGGRTVTNRIFWFIMCIVNLALIVGGLIGIPNVIK